MCMPHPEEMSAQNHVGPKFSRLVTPKNAKSDQKSKIPKNDMGALGQQRWCVIPGFYSNLANFEEIDHVWFWIHGWMRIFLTFNKIPNLEGKDNSIKIWKISPNLKTLYCQPTTDKRQKDRSCCGHSLRIAQFMRVQQLSRPAWRLARSRRILQ